MDEGNMLKEFEEPTKEATEEARVAVKNAGEGEIAAGSPAEPSSVPVEGAPAVDAGATMPSSGEGQNEAVLTPVEKAVKASKSVFGDVYDGDTFRGLHGDRFRVDGVDAPEASQRFGKEAREFTEKFLRERKCKVVPVGEDVYGRTIADVVDEDTGEHLSEALIRNGLGHHFESGRSEMSAKLREAEEYARSQGLGLFGETEGSIIEPREYRRVARSDYQNWLYDQMMDRDLKRIRKVYTPEALKAMSKLREEKAKEEDKALRERVKAEAAPVYNIDETIAVLSGIGFSYENRGMDVSDIRPQDLNRALRTLSDNFGYTAQDIRDEGYDDPYDFALDKIKNAMNIVRTQERRQKAFTRKSVVEQQEEMNVAFFGEDRERYTWFDSEQVEAYSKNSSTRELVRSAIEKGMTANEAYIAAVIALGENQGEDFHRVRLAHLPIDRARKVAQLAGSLRAQYDGNAFAKGFISFANSVEGMARNAKAVVTGRAFGVAGEDYIREVLAQGLEDTLIDNEDSFWGEVATVTGSSIPVMALLTVPYAGTALYAANCYGEASRIPIQEDWHDADPLKTEVFKWTYAAAAPVIEKGALGLAMKPLKPLVAAHVSSPRIAGLFGSSTLAMKLAGAETKGAMSKIAKGISLTTQRSLVSAYGGEVAEEVAEQAILELGGMFVDPKSAEGKKLYGLERFGEGIIDAAWTSIKTGPFMMFPFAAGGVLHEAAVLDRQVSLQEELAMRLGDKRSPLEIRQDAINALAIVDSKLRVNTLGGLSGEEIAPFYTADAETRRRMLEETEDKRKKKWLGELDTYLSYQESFRKRTEAGAAEETGGAAQEEEQPAPKPKNASAARKIREAAENPEEEERERGERTEGTEGTERTERTEGTEERTEETPGTKESEEEAKPEQEERFEDGKPVEGARNADTKNPPRREGGESATPEKGGRTGTARAEADTGDSSQEESGGERENGNKEKQAGTGRRAPVQAVPIKKRREVAKDFSEKTGVLVSSLKEMAKSAILKAEDVADFIAAVKGVAAEVSGRHGAESKEVSRFVMLVEKAGKAYAEKGDASVFEKVFVEADKLLEWSQKKSRERRVPTLNINARELFKEFEDAAMERLEGGKPETSPEQREEQRPKSGRPRARLKFIPAGFQASISGVIRLLSPEFDAAFGIPAPDGVMLNPSLVKAFKAAIEESDRTGVGIMKIFAKVYGRELLGAVSDMDAHKDFVEDPFGWAEATIDRIIEQARRAEDGDEAAEDELERIHFGSNTFDEKAKQTGKVEEHKGLRQFAEFAKKWLRSVFGEGANIYFVEELDGSNPEQRYIIEEFDARRRRGEKVNAALVTESGNVYVSRDANPVKVLHEVLGHATWQWMKKNDAKGYALLREAALNAPESIKELVRRNYGELNPNLTGAEAEAEFDAYLDEIFAHLMEARYAKRVASMFAKTEDRAWYERVWGVISGAVMRLWRSVFGEPDADTVEALLDSLSTRFFDHGGIFMKNDARNEGGLRFSKFHQNPYDDPNDIAALRRGENPDSKEIQRRFNDYVVEDEANSIEARLDAKKLQEERDAKKAAKAADDEQDSEKDDEGAEGNQEEGIGKVADAFDRFVKALGGDAQTAFSASNNPGFAIIDFMSGLRTSYLGKDLSDNEFSLLYEFSQFEKNVSKALEAAGMSYVKLQSETKSRGELGAYLAGKKGFRKEVAKRLINVFKFVSAIPETSKVSFDEADCVRLQREVDEANRIADEAYDAMKGTEEEKNAAFDEVSKEIAAAEKVVALMVEHSGSFLAAKSVFGLYVSRLRPNARRIGRSEGDLTQSDFSAYTVDEMDLRSVSGKSSASLLQDQDFDTVEDLDISLWALVRTYDAVQAFKGTFKSAFENSGNPYVAEAAKHILNIVEKAEKAANDEWVYATAKSKRDANGNLLYPDFETAKAFAEQGMGPKTLPEWIAERVKAKEDRAKSRADYISNTWKRKYGSAGSEHEYQARRMLKLKSLPSEGMLWVVRYLEADDDLHRAPKDRVNPRLRNSKAKPLDAKTRAELEKRILGWLKPSEGVKKIDGESQEEYDRRLNNLSVRNRIKNLHHAYFIGYQNAKKRGEIYGDTAEWEALKAAEREYSELVNLKTFVHPWRPVPDIDNRLESARNVYADALSAYAAVPDLKKSREPHNIARALAEQTGRIVGKDSDLDSIDLFRARVVTIIRERFGGDITKFYEDYNLFGGVGEEILSLKRDLENGDADARRKADEKMKALSKAMAAFGAMARGAKQEAELEIYELSLFEFVEKRGIYVRRGDRADRKERESGVYDSMPRGLREALRKNRKSENRVTDEEVILGWVFRPGFVPRNWVGLFDTMSAQTYARLRELTNGKVESYVKYNIANKQMLKEFQTAQNAGGGNFGGRTRFSTERSEAGNAENEDRGGAKPDPVQDFKEKRYSKTIDFATAFLMRMLRDGVYELDEKLCRNIAYTLDPYMGGETLKGCIEAAKILAKIVRNEPGVEKLDDDALLDLVVSKVETIKEDLIAKIAEAVHDVQTDTWKAIAQSYRARLERYRRTGRDEEHGTLSIADLKELGITKPGTSSNLSSDGRTKQRLVKDSYRGLNRKVFGRIFGKHWPKRADFDSAEDFEKAKDAYKKRIEKEATPELLARYRNTLVWLYGKYGTDSWLRRFFSPGAAQQVRLLVGRLRDTADTVEDIFLTGERIETLLHGARRNLGMEEMLESIRAAIEPFMKGADPRTALKKRKISPRAQEFLKAVYDGMTELTEDKLREKIPDAAGLSPEQLKAKLDALRAEIVAKKADEAAEDYDRDRDSGGDKKPNAARAIASLSRQAGYRLILPYLRLNAQGEDMKDADRTPLQIREELDKIYAEVERVIAEGRQEVQDHIREQDALIEGFLGKVIPKLSKGRSGEVNKGAQKDSALNDLLRRLGALAASGFSLKQRLAELLRYADEDTRKELSALFDEFINTPVATAESEQTKHYLRAREALNRMVLKVYAGGKDAGVGEVASVMQMLNTQLDELARFSEDGQKPLTRAQVMAQVAMLRQESVQAPIAELARKISTGELVRTKEELTEELEKKGVRALTEEERVMMRRLELLGDMVETLRKLSDGKDLKLIDEMVKYYADLAPQIDATAMKITGMAVTTGEAGFFPVRRSSEWASRSTERSSRVIGLVPDYLSPRRNTTTDIAQDADVFSIFTDQAEKNAHFLAFGALHYRLSALFENGDWTHLTNRLLGKEASKMLKDHAQDVCAPNLIFVDNSGDNSFWSAARRFVSIALLGGNVLVAAKQATSFSAFAHEIGWGRLIGAALNNPLSSEMTALRKELFSSPEARMRWGDTWVSIQDAVMARPGKNAKVSTAFAYYMSLQRLGDKVPSWFIAPAVYLANYNALRSRVNPDTGAPFTEAEAKTRAREMVFDMIEKTQQTSRVSDMAHSQRRGQALGQLWTQFASSSILFFSSEARAFRDVAANPKNADAWKRLTGILISNHVVTPSLLKLAELIARALLQGEEPDDDDLEDWIKLMCSGPLSGLVILGNVLTNDRYGDVSAPAVSFAGRLVKNGGKLVGHIVTGEFDEALGDVHKVVSSLVPAYRDGAKLYKAYIDDED